MKKKLFILSLIMTSAFASQSFEFHKKFDDPGILYSKLCASCHGDNLEDIRGRTWVYGSSKSAISQAISMGYPKNGMPAFSDALSVSEIENLSEFILDESKKERIVVERKFINSSDVIKSKDVAFRIETVVDGLKIPWGIASLPNNDLLITEKSGKLYRYNSETGIHSIANVPEVADRGQGGLLDIEIHPNFQTNQLIYLSYSKNEDNGRKSTTAVWRGRLNNDKLENGKDIFVALPYESTNRHFGSRLEFDREGFLFISVGERGNRDDNPQNLSNQLGKIHRIQDDGQIPLDNPFVRTNNAAKSIYSFGHRNPQGLVRHPVTGIIWSNEHGPRGGDEINIVQKGRNYGWPVISYGINYSGTKFTDLTHKEGMEQPEHYWDPSIAVCGMEFISGWRYPKWLGDILVGSLRFEYLAHLKMNGDKIISEEKLLEGIGRLRDVKMGKDGYIYVAVEDPGRILRIVPVN